MLTILFYVRWKEDPGNIKKFIWVGVAFGLTAATKWTALYLLILLMVDFGVSLFYWKQLPERNWFVWVGLSFVIIPTAIYLLSYIQFFIQGHNVGEFIKLQKMIWAYHTGLKATHTYSSVPFQWIFDLRPVWFYVDWSKKTHIANIYNLGNPVILWAGLYAVGYGIFRLVKKWEWPLWILILGYFLFWVPWIFAPRVMYFHHYGPSVPFLVILLAYFLVKRHPKSLKRPNYLLINVCILASLWFVLYFPHLTAIPMPKEFVETFYLIDLPPILMWK